MKWSNERGTSDTGSGTFLIGMILVLAILALAAMTGGSIAGELHALVP